MQNKSSTVVVLGTGGTIAGTAPSGAGDSSYVAAQLSVAELLAGVPELVAAAQGAEIDAEQVAQIDSKDMSWSVWARLLDRLKHHLSRPEVLGVVITHGTDTLEETAYFLHRVLQTTKPVVLTAAMRPATSTEADGPRHLCQSVQVVVEGGWAGVAVVLQSEVHDASTIRKMYPRALRAFASGDVGPLAVLENGVWCWRRALLAADPLVPWDEGTPWPWVEVLHSHAGARAEAVSSWCAAGVQGLVVVATGNGTVHHELETALRQAQAAGVVVWRCTRCPQGGLEPDSLGWSPASHLPPAQTRIALMLNLISK